MDGLPSHFQPDVINRAAAEGVIIFCLPPHTTHLTQSLDKGALCRWKLIGERNAGHTPLLIQVALSQGINCPNFLERHGWRECQCRTLLQVFRLQECIPLTALFCFPRSPSMFYWLIKQAWSLFHFTALLVGNQVNHQPKYNISLLKRLQDIRHVLRKNTMFLMTTTSSGWRCTIPRLCQTHHPVL